MTQLGCNLVKHLKYEKLLYIFWQYFDQSTVYGRILLTFDRFKMNLYLICIILTASLGF